MTTSLDSIVDGVRDIVGEQLGFAVRDYEVAPDDNLWDLGMTSLNCVGLMLAIEDTFDVELPENRLNEDTFRTMTTIAAAVAEAMPDRREQPGPVA